MQQIVNTINPHQISINQANTYKIIIAKSYCKPYTFYKLQRLDTGWTFVPLGERIVNVFGKHSTPHAAIKDALSSSITDIYQFDSTKEAYEWVVNNL